MAAFPIVKVTVPTFSQHSVHVLLCKQHERLVVIRIEMSYCPTCIRRSVLPSLYKMMHGTLV